jgi:hypothetical protein
VGAHPYWYFVPYESDINQALARLRDREFRAGRYSPVVRQLHCDDPGFEEQRPGPAHANVLEAVRAAERSGEGTRSILDISRIGPEPGWGVSYPLSTDEMDSLFGAEKPSHGAIAAKMDAIFTGLRRGHCLYIVVYEGGQPAELFFAGYSCD